MKRYRNPFMIMGRVFAIIGGCLLLVCLVLFAALYERENDIWLFLLPFGINGMVFLSIGLVFWLVQRRKRLLQEQLLSQGEAISAQVLGLEPNPSVRINGRCPMRLICRYEENGTSYLCRSENLQGYPRLCQDTVTVYRDPYNIKRYYVDVSTAIEYDVEL